MPDKSRLAIILGDLSTGADAVLEALGEQEAAALVGEVGKLASLALSAYREAAGTAITPDSILKLLPADTALKPASA